MTDGAHQRPAARSQSAELMTIGRVLELLRPDYPSVNHNKIRFWEERGLVSPVRMPSGYRKYSLADVDRLRYVMHLQSDRFFPLKKIAEHLEALDRGEEPPPYDDGLPTVPTLARAADGLPSADYFRRRDDVRLSRKELLKIAEIDEAVLAELERHGLVAANPGTSRYDPDALVICVTARELGEFGIEPRHLRAFKAAADREVGLVEQVMAPHRRTGDAAAQARADDVGAQVTAMSVRLHATLVRAGLRRR